MSPHAEQLRRLTRPLEPEETGEQPRLEPMKDCRAVAFDIYGTLFLSACGDIGLTAPSNRGEAILEALQSQGMTVTEPADHAETCRDLGDAFVEALRSAQDREREKGTEWPEVDIREVWRDFLQRGIAERHLEGLEDLPQDPEAPLLEALAVHDEALSNPVWPAPGLEALLTNLKTRGLPLAIVSNAQFYTPHLFDAFLGGLPSELGFDEALQVYSYQLREGKPSTRLYEILAERLRARGIDPSQCLYIGNDRLKDVWPAQQVGFRTALYAGDARSLRWRHEDARLRGVVPDLVITELAQVSEVLDA